MLSPGEMQRLSFARLFYHQPMFAGKLKLLSVCLCLYLCLCQSVSIFRFLSVCLSLFICVCPFFCLTACLSVCLILYTGLYLFVVVFLVLDEATSALDIATETAMYDLCRRFDITVVSVGHRETLVQVREQQKQEGRDKHTQTERQTETETDRQTDRQTDRETEKQTTQV